MKLKKWIFIILGVIAIVGMLSYEFLYSPSHFLIPRHILFGNPEKIAVQVSPNGKYISYLAASKKHILNVWIQDIARKKKPKMVTHDTKRNILNYAWSKDSRYILYKQDRGGNENWHFYVVTLSNGALRDLTPYKNVSVRQVLLNKYYPDEVLIGMNRRDSRLMDVYRINLKSGKELLEAKNPGNIAAWYANVQFRIKAALAQNLKDGSSNLLVRDGVHAYWYPIVHWPFGENGGVVTFSKNGKHLVITSTLNSNTSRLLQINAHTGKFEKVLAKNKYSDINGVLVNSTTYKVEAVRFNYLKPKWQVIDPKVKADFNLLTHQFSGALFFITSQDNANKLWVVVYIKDNMPPVYYLYDRQNKKITKLFSSIPQLQRYPLVKTKPIIIAARDGLPLVSYLTIPSGYRFHEFPMVLLVHGGPWARDSWGFSPLVQWLANRGYAVLQINFRGSDGFGKQFLNAGNGQWGRGAMQDDLSDAVHWAIKHRIADPQRICIYGGSYGGYATLAGLTFTPHLYACGVDIVGPSDLKTLMNTIPPYWYTGRKELLLRIGNVRKDDELNRRISPLYHADKIRVPLLIAQGKNDARVKIIHSDKIVAVMRKNKLPVTYLVYTNEGHGFVQPNNRLDFYGRTEKFLSEYLGGAYEPWRHVKGTMVEVR